MVASARLHLTMITSVMCAASLIHSDHLNNAVYVTYFDAIINEYLITRCKMNPSSQNAPIGLVISSNFSYNAALEFPAPLLAGLSVTKYAATTPLTER
jgi:acyl-CoA thioesterase FadM